jgi:hypothetical protein
MAHHPLFAIKRLSLAMSPSSYSPPCDDLVILKEKVAALEMWRANTEADLKDIRDIISQVKLLMSLSIGGGGLSVLTLIMTLILLVTGRT